MSKKNKKKNQNKPGNGDNKSMNGSDKKKLFFVICFALTLLMAILSRTILLNKVPGDINQDEAFAGYNALTLLKNGKDNFGNPFPVYLTAWGSGMNALESYLMIPFIAIFGVHNYVVRIPMVLSSILSLVCLYFMAKKLEDVKFATFLFFFASVMPWHIMISRWALESNLAPAFILFGLFFFIKGIDNQKFFILSAVMYGLSLYSYATIWVVVPLIVLAQIIYLICLKKVKFSGWTIGSLVILFLFALPLILFVLVNNGKLDEIRLPFMTIQKMVYYRGNEVSLKNIPANFKNLVTIIFYGDGLPWNYIAKFRLYYHFSLFFALVGFVVGMIYMVKNTKKKAISLDFFMLVILIAGVIIGCLIKVNVNRVNIIHFPIIYFAARGVFFVADTINAKLLIPVAVVYLVFFGMFEKNYYTEYKDEINAYFVEGAEGAIKFVKNELADCQHVYIDSSISYSTTYLYLEEDLDTMLSTVQYSNYPSPYLSVSSFDKYTFGMDYNAAADGVSAYVVNAYSDNPVLAQNLAAAGYACESFGRYEVYYLK